MNVDLNSEMDEELRQQIYDYLQQEINRLLSNTSFKKTNALDVFKTFVRAIQRIGFYENLVRFLQEQAGEQSLPRTNMHTAWSA
jgi:hypothetical protein